MLYLTASFIWFILDLRLRLQWGQYQSPGLWSLVCVFIFLHINYILFELIIVMYYVTKLYYINIYLCYPYYIKSLDIYLCYPYYIKS